MALHAQGSARAPAVRAGGSFTVRRLFSTRLLLSAVFAAVLVCSAVAGALVSLSLRTLPAAVLRQLAHSAGQPIDISGQLTLGQAAAVDAITGNARLTAGSWPGQVPAHGPVPVAVPAAAAGPLRLAVGEDLTVRNDYTGRPVRRASPACSCRGSRPARAGHKPGSADRR